MTHFCYRQTDTKCSINSKDEVYYRSMDAFADYRFPFLLRQLINSFGRIVNHYHFSRCCWSYYQRLFVIHICCLIIIKLDLIGSRPQICCKGFFLLSISRIISSRVPPYFILLQNYFVCVCLPLVPIWYHTFLFRMW